MGRRAWLSMSVVAAFLVAAAPAAAAAPPPSSGGLAAPLERPVWLCRPGMAGNACGQEADGRSSAPSLTGRYADGLEVGLDAARVDPADPTGPPVATEPLPVAEAPPVDCFYAYPTVDVVANPVLQIGSTPPDPRPEDVAVTLSQVGRFAPQCRLFVPLYRQIAYTSILTTPLTGLKTGVMDVEQAWDSYWAHDNVDPGTGRRRGVVLLGHSQGTIVASQLVQDRFDGNPEATAQLVSAVLLGGNVQVPIGATSGGGNDPASTFQHIPACERASAAEPVPTGCVVAYSSFDQAGGDAPGLTIFGRNSAPGHQVLCVNPAALLDGAPATAERPVDAYFPNSGLLHGSLLDPTGALGLVLLGFTPETGPAGFTHYPGPGTVRCASAGNAQSSISWLQISGADAYVIPASRYTPFGTHVADFSITSGDLSRLIAAQTRQWQSGG